TGYANLSDCVIAPSESVAEVLKRRGVNSRIESIPTGIDTELFSIGNGKEFRKRNDIPSDATVIGHVGRLAPEKNLEFLSLAVSSFIKNSQSAHFLVVGDGPSTPQIKECFKKQNLLDCLHMVGRKSGSDLIDAYHAMDLFAFASKSETQGMVLAEAMAAGLPVVALDAPGVREIVTPRRNGTLIYYENVGEFSRALFYLLSQTPQKKHSMFIDAKETSEEFSVHSCASRTLSLYRSLLSNIRKDKGKLDPWESTMRYLEREWSLITNKTTALGSAIIDSDLRDNERTDN
ncbi:MAG: glycosyltransferase, partial [Bdellovibrionales bacterium]|nr:glycosyltransferase [Bdellovibrionales bacterium]